MSPNDEHVPPVDPERVQAALAAAEDERVDARRVTRIAAVRRHDTMTCVLLDLCEQHGIAEVMRNLRTLAPLFGREIEDVVQH